MEAAAAAAAAAAAPPQCRFCLDDERPPPHNPFIEPCICIGSARYVHWSCLQQWIQQDPYKNGHRCTICKTPFKVNVYPGYEEDRVTGFLPSLVLNNTSAVSLCIYYIFFICYLNLPVTQELLTRILFHSEIVLHAVYAVTAAKSFKVKNARRYRRYFLESRIPFMLIAHAICMASFMARKDTLMAICMNILVGYYWHEHTQILKVINRTILHGHYD
jgi:hypothetical protein